MGIFFLLFLLQKVVDKLFDTSSRSLFLEKQLDWSKFLITDAEFQ